MINEIDYNKYIVIKTIDLQYLNINEQKEFSHILRKIDSSRMEKENKGVNRYLVLNSFDEISLQFLKICIIEKQKTISGKYNITVNDISVDIINSILIRK